MRNTLLSLTSYLFTISVVIIAVSAFGAVIIGLRSFFSTIGETEKELGYKFLIIFISSGIAAPLFLHLNRKFEKDTREYEDLY